VNLSSEAPDIPDDFFIGYAKLIPPLGTDFSITECAALCEAPTLQAALLCAQRAALQCIATDWQPPGQGDLATPVPPAVRPPGRGHTPTFVNTQQEATVNCPDGTPFTYTIPAGVFFGLSQSQADEAAQSFAQQQAVIHQICLSPIQNRVCVDTPYNATITASSRFLARAPSFDVWELTSGQIPPGLTIPEFIVTTGLVRGGTIHLQGTPTVPGIYNFSIGITLPNGDFQNVPYTIAVMGITNGLALPDGAVGQAYSQNVNSGGVTNPIFSVESGALPDGLSLDGGGIIFGTPTVADDFHFTLGVTEAGTGITCTSTAAISVVAVGINWNDLVYDPPLVNSGASSGGGTGANFTASAAGAGGSPATYVQRANVTYTGDATNCNLHIDYVNGLGGDTGGVTFSIFDTTNSIAIITGGLLSGDPSGPYDFPFVIPLSAGINYRLTFQASIPNAGAFRSCSFTGSLTPAF